MRTPAGVLKAVYAAQSVKDLGWILLAFAIFNTYMLLMATQVNAAVFGVFLTLEVTEIVLFIAFFTGSSGTIKAGGYIGVVTALVAWYTSAAGVANGLPGRLTLPVGRPHETHLTQPARRNGPGGIGPRDRFAYPGPASRRAVPPGPMPPFPPAGPGPSPAGPMPSLPPRPYRPSPAGPIP